MTTKACPADSRLANSFAILTDSVSVPSYRIRALPDDSQNAIPNFAPGIEEARVS